MASSSSSAMHFSDQTSDLSCQTELEMESSRIRHWSNLDYSNKSSEWSVETNFEHYSQLKKHREWGRFFRDCPSVELGKKISEGAQADIYEARRTSYGPFNLVAKVMKGDAPLQAFQAQWPVGMLSASKNYIVSHRTNLPLMTILGGTLLDDERLKGRFAFVMNRRWGDLRLLIDRRMKVERSTVGPFFMYQVIQLMLRIAEDMEGLHNKYDILHRDLKASNVLVWGKFGDNVDVVAPSIDEKIESVVADFECSVGVLGTGWWRAPEILQQLRGGVPSSKWQFSRKSDVYSYGMTSYEIVSGHVPFEDSFKGKSALEAINEVINGRRPNLPYELPSFLKSIIESCWQIDPITRPNFSEICMMLKNKQVWYREKVVHEYGTKVVIDNESEQKATNIRVEQWSHLEPLTLLLTLERLLQMQLWVSEAKTFHRHSKAEMIVQYFKVTDGERKKICNEDIIANIVKVLSLPVKKEWIAESSEDAGSTSIKYLIHIMSKTGELSLLRRISALLSGMSIQVYDVRCWNHNALVECVMYVEGGKVELLQAQILAQEARRDAPVDCKIALRELPSRDAFVHLKNAYDGGTSFEQFLLWKLLETGDTVEEPYLVQISSETGGPSLLGRISAILTEMKIQVYEVRIRSHTDHVEFAISVDASILDSMLQRFLAKEAGSETPVDCKIVLRKLASRYVDWDFLDEKSSDLRALRSPPAMRIDVGIDDSGFLPVRVICLDRPEFLVDVACSFLDSSIVIKRYEVPSYGGIKVPRSCMVEDTYYQIDDGERRSRFKDFVRRHLKVGWNVHFYDILQYDTMRRIKLKDHVNRHLISGDKLELICKIGFGDLIQRLQKNGLFVSSVYVRGPYHEKRLITFFVASDIQ